MNIIKNTEFKSNGGPIQRVELIIEDVKKDEFENACILLGVKMPKIEERRTRSYMDLFSEKEVEINIERPIGTPIPAECMSGSSDNGLEQLQHIGEHIKDVEARLSKLEQEYKKPVTNRKCFGKLRYKGCAGNVYYTICLNRKKCLKSIEDEMRLRKLERRLDFDKY